MNGKNIVFQKWPSNFSLKLLIGPLEIYRKRCEGTTHLSRPGLFGFVYLKLKGSRISLVTQRHFCSFSERELYVKSLKWNTYQLKSLSYELRTTSASVYTVWEKGSWHLADDQKKTKTVRCIVANQKLHVHYFTDDNRAIRNRSHQLIHIGEWTALLRLIHFSSRWIFSTYNHNTSIFVIT